jgi:DNA invertase Pin-like site-specific DNA recombinase
MQIGYARVSTDDQDLLKVMVDPNSPAASRIRAADCVLGHTAKGIELEDIEVRVRELERAAEASKPA